LLGKRHALAHTLDHDDPRDVVLLRHQQE
jgi:hypothetical protein